MGWFRRRVISAFLFTGLICVSSEGYAASARSVFDRLNRCAQDQSLDTCRSDVTSTSTDMYDRFDSYGLANCLPDDVTFVSEKNTGSQSVIRAKTHVSGTARYMRLIFTQEKKQWKLDIPASLQYSLGEQWQQRVALMEALYLALRQQMGSRLDCASAQALVQ